MRGDSILIEEHHRRAAAGAVALLPETVRNPDVRTAISVAGESGSGKSEIAQAIVDLLAADGIPGMVLGQDDYFALPPRSNDRARREDITRVGPREVRLDLMSEQVRQLLSGAGEVVKPLVLYAEDRIESETITAADVRVVVAEGTYTSLIEGIDVRIFIDRTFEETRAHRMKRMRHASELDPFIDRVLQIEHAIISAHKARAHIVINSGYEAESGPAAPGG